MNKIAELQDNILFDDGTIVADVDVSKSTEDKAKESNRIKRDLIQMYVDSALRKGDNFKDVENHLLRIAPGFSHIAIEQDLEGYPTYRAIWKD